MTEFTDDKFDENGGKFSKRVKKTLGKGKWLDLSNFYFSHSVLKRHVLQTGKNKGLFGKELMKLHHVPMCI